MIRSALFAAAILVAAPVSATAVVGQPAPTFTATDSNGKTVRLCRWCRSWWGTSGTLPTRDILERHHRGERIKRSA
jgi:hypothetical protein